jgi:hypothetical protein
LRTKLIGNYTFEGHPERLAVFATRKTLVNPTIGISRKTDFYVNQYDTAEREAIRMATNPDMWSGLPLYPPEGSLKCFFCEEFVPSTLELHGVRNKAAARNLDLRTIILDGPMVYTRQGSARGLLFVRICPCGAEYNATYGKKEDGGKEVLYVYQEHLPSARYFISTCQTVYSTKLLDHFTSQLINQSGSQHGFKDMHNEEFLHG